MFLTSSLHQSLLSLRPWGQQWAVICLHVYQQNVAHLKETHAVGLVEEDEGVVLPEELRPGVDGPGVVLDDEAGHEVAGVPEVDDEAGQAPGERQHILRRQRGQQVVQP